MYHAGATVRSGVRALVDPVMARANFGRHNCISGEHALFAMAMEQLERCQNARVVMGKEREWIRVFRAGVQENPQDKHC